jgi:hypothetical protein
MARQQTGTKLVQNADGSHSRVPVYQTTPERVTFNKPSSVPLHHAPVWDADILNARTVYVDDVPIGTLYGLNPSPSHGSPTSYAFVPANSEEVAFTASRLSEARVDIERYVDSHKPDAPLTLDRIIIDALLATDSDQEPESFNSLVAETVKAVRTAVATEIRNGIEDSINNSPKLRKSIYGGMSYTQMLITKIYDLPPTESESLFTADEES